MRSTEKQSNKLELKWGLLWVTVTQVPQDADPSIACRSFLIKGQQCGANNIHALPMLGWVVAPVCDLTKSPINPASHPQLPL